MPPRTPPPKRKGLVDQDGRPVRFDSLPTTRVIITPTVVTPVPRRKPLTVDMIYPPKKLKKPGA